MAKSKTWQCSGTTDSPHDSFENFGPDCSVCGAKREDIEGPQKKGKKDKAVGSGAKPPIAAIAAGLAGGLAVLGVGYLISPNIPGLCGAAQNCQAWQTDLTKAKRNVNEAKATVANKAASKQEMENGQKKAGEAIKLLASLNQQESMKKDIKTPLDEAKKADTDLATRIAQAGKPLKPETSPSPPPQPTGGTTVSPPPRTVPPVYEAEPEMITRREEPAPQPEPEPVQVRDPEPVYIPPAPQPESRPASSAPAREEELIPR